MIRPSSCPSRPPDTATKPAEEHRSYTTAWDTIQAEIKTLGTAIYSALYEPPLDTPIKTLDIPVAGRGYGTLPFVFDLVNMSNSVKIPDSTNKKAIKDNLPKDEDGSQTVRFLRNVRRRVTRITGMDPATIGPHPAVYFYTLGGTFQPTAFLATSELFDELEHKGKLIEFTKVRREFEEFFLVHKRFLTQIIHKQGSGVRSLTRMKSLLMRLVEEIGAGKVGDQINEALRADPEFSFRSCPKLWCRSGAPRRVLSPCQAASMGSLMV
jgi:hypothetical protein